MNDTKNNDLPLTIDALADLSADLASLAELCKEKKQKIEKKETETSWNLKNKDIKIAVLQESCVEVVSNIDEIIKRLDRVMENNGTSNNYN